jgi:hypothetical protein
MPNVNRVHGVRKSAFYILPLLSKHGEETFFQESLLFKVEVLLLPIPLFPRVKKNRVVVRPHSGFAPCKAKWVSSFPFSSNKNPVQCQHNRVYLFIGPCISGSTSSDLLELVQINKHIKSIYQTLINVSIIFLSRRSD